MSGLSPSTMLTVDHVLAALKIGSSFDFEGAIAAFEGEDPMVKIDTGLMAAEDVAKIIGLFVPGAATAAEYIDIARVILPIALPILIKLYRELPPPAPLQPGEYTAWGHTFNGTITQGTFK